MQWGKRGPGSPSRRRRAAFQPDHESLEGRRLLTTFDLTQTQTHPYGVELVGKSSMNIAGYTVTDVGDVTGSHFDSFTIAATGDSNTTVGSKPLNPTFSNGSAVYLVFGSKQVNMSTVASYLTLANGVSGGAASGNQLTSGNRAGDLGELGTLGVGSQTDIPNPIAQTNPTVFQPQPPLASSHVYGFNFDGLTFVTGLNATTGLGSSDGLGYSVTPLGDINNSGFDSFAISAPNDGTTGGRVFVIYGGNALTTQAVANKTIDLEPTPGTISKTTPTKVVSFFDSLATSTSEVGYSIAGIGNYFGKSSSLEDLAIGAPGMTVAGVSGANTGVVFTVSGNFINTQTSGASVDLSTLYSGLPNVSANAISGIEYTGFVPGGELGYSVSTAGNFDGVTATNSSPQDDLLIGAPGSSGGQAYVVYGQQPFLQNQLIGSTQSLASLGTQLLTSVGVPLNPLQGVIFADNTAGDGFGFSVSTAGDFDDDGVDDILVGAPTWFTNTGYAAVIYGLKGTATTTTTTKLTGTNFISPLAPTPGLKAVTWTGEAINQFAGFSVASSGHIQFGTSTAAAPSFDILAGAPGLTSAEVYDIPGTAAGAPAETGALSFSNTNTTLNGNEFTVLGGTSDPAINSNSGGFGTSVSARNLVIDPLTSTEQSVDTDTIPDLFFGAPYSSLLTPNSPLVTTRNQAGVAYVIEGSLLGGTTGTGTSPGTGATGSTNSISSFTTIVNTLQPVVFTGDDSGLPNPPISALSHLNSYAPLPVQLAYQQFLPKPGFLAREQVALHPSQKGGSHSAPAGTELDVAAISRSESPFDKDPTLSKEVRTRGKTKVGVKTTFTHKVKVIPTSEQTETYPG
jgi:hypothetical protein